ncbi:hypothetical protein SADUNF_Sadunf18G0051600 [Salix dunnii]|uniref:MYB transcription factor n=1 Tax=Salix dunnii TaxID=1413687 RepID=A0A835MDH2_9ROSI|nr:hypothetical protein SADUNF_Sadunf18G0051600 [Salix dunnii]
MGNPKQKWTSEEEEALRAGVAKHGTGKWKNIQRDPEFNPYLYSRSNIDLKVFLSFLFFLFAIVIVAVVWYNAMIFEAISALNEPNGADTSAIISYIECNFFTDDDDIPNPSAHLVQNCYKIKKSSSFGTKTPTPKQKEMRPKPVQNTDLINSGDTVTEAADDAAYMVAEAENKSFVATEAVKESERVSKMAEDANSLLQLASEILEKCSRGEIVVMG